MDIVSNLVKMLKSQFIYFEMENIKTYKNQIEEVQNLIGQLENGNLSKDDLVRLESLTRMIHERSIILKYMAFGNVPEVEVEEKVLENSFVEKEIEEKDETISFESPVEEKVEIDLFGDFEKKEEIEEEVEIPSSIFDIMKILKKKSPISSTM